MPLLRHCNTGRTCLPLPQHKNFPTYTRCSENHNNTFAENRKIRGFKFDTLVAPSGGKEKNLNMDAQLQVIPYKKPPKHF